MLVTIHQPNFLPWFPFFQKWAESDRLVLLTRCQWSKGGFQNRFRIGDTWHTMSVEQGLQPIIEKRYMQPFADWERIKRNLPEYDLGRFDHCINHDLCQTNISLIYRLAQELGVSSDICMDYDTDLIGTARLVDICRRHGATTYLSGPSGLEYLDVNMFRAAGIGVEFFSSPDRVHALEVIHDRAV